MTNDQSGCLVWAIVIAVVACLVVALDHGCIVIPALQSEPATTPAPSAPKPVTKPRPSGSTRYY